MNKKNRPDIPGTLGSLDITEEDLVKAGVKEEILQKLGYPEKVDLSQLMLRDGSLLNILCKGLKRIEMNKPGELKSASLTFCPDGKEFVDGSRMSKNSYLFTVETTIFTDKAVDGERTIYVIEPTKEKGSWAFGVASASNVRFIYSE